MKLLKNKYFLTSLLLSFLAFSSWQAQDNALDQEGSNEFASRSTELGKIQRADKNELEKINSLNDNVLAQAWGLHEKHTAAIKAWQRHKTMGSRDIVVAVIDTGIDVRHPALQNNLWVNKGEVGVDSQGRDKSSNGIDDDRNGYKDDVHGFNFVGNNNDLTDNHGHGTHIAGLIGAEKINNSEFSGVSPKVSLMILKYYDPKAKSMNNLMNTVKAIEYATKMNARIINYSGGGLQASIQEKQAIEKAYKKKILFVAAAGNERSNSDDKPYYPADYDLDNIISVTAFDKTQNILPTSNYGERTVDIAAPGNGVKSTLPGGGYGKMTGTSQATAFVTGTAALIMSKFGDFTPSQVVKHINTTGDFAPDQLKGKTRYKKRLNVYRALAILDQGINADGGVTTNTINMKSGTFSTEDEDFLVEADRDVTANNVADSLELVKAVQKLNANTLTRATADKTTRGVQGNSRKSN